MLFRNTARYNGYRTNWHDGKIRFPKAGVWILMVDKYHILYMVVVHDMNSSLLFFPIFKEGSLLSSEFIFL